MPSVNWITGEITVPISDLQLIQAGPPAIYQHDTEAFRLALKDLEDDVDGRPWPDTHRHNLPYTISGITYAQSIEIIPPYFVTYEVGTYRVSLTGSNNNIADVATINGVGIIANNSAGQTFSKEIQDQSYVNASVLINVNKGLPGTIFPRGTPTSPVDNFDDAQAIAAARNFNSFQLVGDLVLGPSDSITEQVWQGLSPNLSSINLGGGATSACKIVSMKVDGTFNGVGATLVGCEAAGITNICGIFDMCALSGDIIINPACNDVVSLINCYSQVAGLGRPKLDLNGSTAEASVRGYTGGLTIAGITSGQNVSIDVRTGTIEIDATCTDGLVLVRGGEVVDNSGANCTVIHKPTLNESETVKFEEMWARLGLDPNRPLDNQPDEISFGAVVMDITGDGENSSTVTRRP